MMEQSIQPGYLSLKAASLWASVSLKTLKRWIASGLPVYQGSTGGKVLVKPQDIDQFLQRRQVPQVDVNALVDETLREMGLGERPQLRNNLAREHPVQLSAA